MYDIHRPRPAGHIVKHLLNSYPIIHNFISILILKTNSVTFPISQVGKLRPRLTQVSAAS